MYQKDMKNLRVAVLITGTYREIEFLLKLFPSMAGPIDYDIFLVLRHVRDREESRLGKQEPDFDMLKLVSLVHQLPNRNNIFICELPSIDPSHIMNQYIVPTGPDGENRECGMFSMIWGVYAAIKMMKASLRTYTHVMKTRTDYLPWLAPWLTEMLKCYEESGQKIIVDGLVTEPRRYPDRLDIPWQGSVSDIFCFCTPQQFFTLWDTEDILRKIWTGTSETTLFRAAMFRFLGDDLQSPRRNTNLLKRYFTWVPNNSRPSFYLLRSGVLTEQIKERILYVLKSERIPVDKVNDLIRVSYDFIIGQKGKEPLLKEVVNLCFQAQEAEQFLNLCASATKEVCPV